MAQSLFKDIIAEVYYIFGENESSGVFNREKYIKPLINSIEDDISLGVIMDNTVNPPRAIELGILRPFYKEQFIKNLSPTKLVTAVEEDTTEIEVADGTEYPDDGGYIYINGNTIQYGYRDGNTLYNLSGVETAHKAGSTVRYIHKTPVLVGNYDICDSNDIPLKRVDIKDDNKGGLTWSIVNDNFTDNSSYILIDGKVGETYKLTYTKQATEMVDETDPSNLPGKYGKTITAKLVAGTALINTSEIEKGKIIFNEGLTALRQFIQVYGKKNKTFRKKIIIAPFK